MKKIFLALSVVLFLSACSKSGPTAPLEGRRSLSDIEKIEITKQQPKLSQGEVVKSWYQQYKNAQNARISASVSPEMELRDSVSIGKGITDDSVMLIGPVVRDGIAYTLDSRFRLQATDIEKGKKLWRKKLADVKGTSSKSVGLSTYKQALYAVAGNGLVVALDLKGTELWRKDLKTALRSAPIISDGRLFVSSINNELFCLSTETGKQLWNYVGERATTNFYGVGNPAVSGNTVLMPMTNGRINAFDTKTGVLVWTETLWQKKTYSPLLDMPHITASPLIEEETAYLIGNAGKSGAYRLKDGYSLFTTPIGGRETPIIDGNTLFVQTNQGEVKAINKLSGEQFWSTSLTNGRTWYGPVLTQKTLILTSSKGDLLFLDAQNGQEIRHDLEDEFIAAPVFGADRMLILTTDGDLLIYQ